MRVIQDDTGVIEEVYIKCIQNEFKNLNKALKFIYAFRTDPKFKEGQVVVASVTKMSPKLRDLFGVDVVVEVCKTCWDKQTKKERYRTAYHELKHVEVVLKNDNKGITKSNIKLDNEGRVKFKMCPHDFQLKRFADELVKFGLSDNERKMIELMQKTDELHQIKKKKRKKK